MNTWLIPLALVAALALASPALAQDEPPADGGPDPLAHYDIARSPDAFKIITAFDGVLRVAAPRDFTPMTADQIAIKYPGGNGPKLVYTDPTARIDLALVRSNLHGAEKTDLIEMARGFRDSMARNIAVTRWLATDVMEINGQPVGHLSFVTPIADSDDYGVLNRMYLLYGAEALYIVTFNCITSDEEAAACTTLSNSIQNSIALEEGE